MLAPTDEEEAGMGQLGLVQTEPWLAAAVAAHSSVRLSFLGAPSCFHHLGPIHRAAAAAGIGIGGVDYLQV